MKQYYPSFNALCDWKKGSIGHLFLDPVELLANAKGLQLKGQGRRFHAEKRGAELFEVPLPPDIRELLSSMVPSGVHIGKRWWNIVSKSRKRGISLEKGFKKLILFYRIVPRVRRFLYAFHGKEAIDTLIDTWGLGVSLETLRVLELEETLRFSKTDKVAFSVMKRYKQNVIRLDCMRTVLDGVALCYHEILKTRPSLPSKAIGALNHLKNDCWRDPWATAKAIKVLATECRAYFFGGPCPRNALVSWMSAKEALQFSYLARSLPSPIVSTIEKNALVLDLADRLCQPPPEEPPDWRPFVRDWLKRMRGKRPISLTAEPSVSAALGYSGERWGHSGAYRDIWVYQLGRRAIQGDLEPYLLSITKSVQDIRSSVMTDAMFLGDIRVSRFLNTIFLDGCESMLDFIQSLDGAHLPALPIAAPEKGLKIRVPTMGLTAANIVQQAFRKAVDFFLLNDARSSRSLGGDRHQSLHREKGPWYSQDLTFATDNHGFWAQRVLYEEVMEYVPELRRWERFIPLLFGPRRLILPNSEGDTKVPEPPVLTTTRETPIPGVITRNGVPLPLYERSLPGVNLFDVTKIELASDEDLIFDLWFDAWNKDPNEKPYQDSYDEMVSLSANGIKLARVPDSLEDFCFGPKPPPIGDGVKGAKQRSLKLEDIIAFSRKYEVFLESCVLGTNLTSRITTRGAMMGEPTSWAVLPLVSFYAMAKVGKTVGLTTGDDALVPHMTASDRVIYDDAMASLGGVISKSKSFLHKRRGLFCEVPYVDGIEKRFFPLSFWAAPSGGSKGEVHWYNLPAAFRGSLISQGVEPTRKSLGQFGLFKYSKFRSTWRAALNMGLPIGAPEIMGGIGVPHFPVVPGRLEANWFAYLSSISLNDLHLFGGLSLVPQLDKQDIKAAELVYNLVYKKQMVVDERPGFIPIAEAVMRARNPSAVRKLFSRPRMKTMKHAPSVRNLARKFHYKICNVRVMRPPGSVSLMREDLLGKQTRFVPDSDSQRLMSGRNFGFAIRSSTPLAPLKWGKRDNIYDTVPIDPGLPRPRRAQRV